MPYLDGVGRTPKVKILAQIKVGPGVPMARVVIQELTVGNPFELGRSAGGHNTEPYFVYERDVYQKLSPVGDNFSRYTLQGAPSLDDVPVVESEQAFWDEYAKKDSKYRKKWSSA